MNTEIHKPKPRLLRHSLMGTSLTNLFRLFAQYGFVSPGQYGRVFVIGLSIIGRLPFTWAEKIYVALKRDKVESGGPPIFILGHWRSGTTHLYNIMSRGKSFATVSPFAVGLPWDFLVISRLFARWLKKGLPKERYIDDVEVSADAPQEDEIGLAGMTKNSFVHAIYFPKDFASVFNRGVFFDGVPAGEVAEWERRLQEFYLKLQIESPGKTILIKNPAYTARVKRLLALYPDAKFIHIARNPFKIFFSMRNFFQKLLPQYALQNWTEENFDELILRTYPRMMDALAADIKGLAKDRFVEIDYEDLQNLPLKELGKIYKQLGLKGFTDDIGSYEAYLKSIKGYKKNVYNYEEADLKMIEKNWGKYIKKGKYKRP